MEVSPCQTHVSCTSAGGDMIQIISVRVLESNIKLSCTKWKLESLLSVLVIKYASNAFLVQAADA